MNELGVIYCILAVEGWGSQDEMGYLTPDLKLGSPDDALQYDTEQEAAEALEKLKPQLDKKFNSSIAIPPVFLTCAV